MEGWVGVLQKGSRAKAGFSILHRKRLIKGWPDSWRPEKVFGVGGRNDLINQRVVGEVNLEEFEVSHTKDEINWNGLEEELVEKGLRNVCKPFMETARNARRGVAVEHGPSDLHVDAAVQTVEGRCCTARSKLLTSLCRWQSHPAQYVSGIPSAVILLSISHPIRCSTRCLANVRVRISGPMIAL